MHFIMFDRGALLLTEVGVLIIFRGTSKFENVIA